MPRRLLPLVAVAVFVLAAGCGSVAPTALTVDGSRISERSLNEELRQLRDNRAYRQAANLTDATVVGDGKNATFKSDFVAQRLTLRLYYRLIHREVVRRHITISASDLTRARAGAGGPQATRLLAGFSSSYRDEVVRRQAEVTAVQQALGRSYFDSHKDEFGQVCVMHVLVATKAAADQVRADLGAGADFGQVASDRSTDPSAKQNRGDLGCAAASGYVAPFRAASLRQPIGQVGAPVKTSFGWHVIKVYERKSPSFRDASAQAQQQGLQTWLTDALAKADIHVNPKYGRFTRSAGPNANGQQQLARIVPNPAPRSATTVPGR